MSKKYFLLLKTHNETKLKYLCKHFGTKESCFIYPGSGLRWRAHLRKHGYNILTEILFETDNLEELKLKGIEFSTTLNVVESNEFANLVVEDGTGGHEAMKNPLVREKARQTMLKRHQEQGLSQKEIERSIKKSERQARGEFTKAELAAAKACSKRQLGKTMAERLNDPNYIDPRKGKTAKEIFGNEYKGAWNKGKTLKEIKGVDYIRPVAKPFIVKVNGISTQYNSEKEFIDKTGYKNIFGLKYKKMITILKSKRSTHNFHTGDVLEFEWLSQ